MDQELINQLKNWLFNYLVLISAAPPANNCPGDEYAWIVPPIEPGEEREAYAERLEKACVKALQTLQVSTCAELRQVAGICIDMLVVFLLEPLEKKMEVEVFELKEKLKKYENRSKIAIPTSAEMRKHGN